MVNDAIQKEVDRVAAIEDLGGDTKPIEDVIKALKGLKDLSCTVCKMTGHVRSYCWLNAQMYAELRDKPDAHVAWAYSKKHAAMEAKQQHHLTVADAVTAYEAAKLKATVPVLKKRVFNYKA